MKRTRKRKKRQRGMCRVHDTHEARLAPELTLMIGKP
jgi:hypothetical protein